MNSLNSDVNSLNNTTNSVIVENSESKLLSKLLDDIQSDEALKKNQKIQQLFKFNSSILPANKLVDKNFRKPRKEKVFLAEKHPYLTDQEKRLCVLISKNKTCHEIADIMGLSYGSARVYKTKLKTKLNLKPQDCLESYLEGFI